jgi:hypothetical protein
MGTAHTKYLYTEKNIYLTDLQPNLTVRLGMVRGIAVEAPGLEKNNCAPCDGQRIIITYDESRTPISTTPGSS